MSKEFDKWYRDFDDGYSNEIDMAKYAWDAARNRILEILEGNVEVYKKLSKSGEIEIIEKL